MTSHASGERFAKIGVACIRPNLRARRGLIAHRITDHFGGTVLCISKEMANISSVDGKTSFFGSKPPDSRPHTRVEDEMAVERKYTFGDVLGQGIFGVVREVTNRASGNQDSTQGQS